MADVTVAHTFLPADYTAHLFDLDGVITPTAEVHMHAWADMFQRFLTSRGIEEPYTGADYYAYVDGRPRYDGVRTFLSSRGITVDEGTDEDPGIQEPDTETVRGLGNRKNDLVLSLLRSEGVAPYPGTVAYLDALPRTARLAIVSSSRNAEEVLRAAGLLDRFEHIVDGNVATREGLPGKPAPDTFLHAARLLGVEAADSVVYEDAVSGVQAGASGDFGAVIGVDRGAGRAELTAAGATFVVADLEEIS
ncbi:beta-phosphoglucomutase family hydrolase [Brachybacterium paraconglomeratum]|uniref:HAD family hydrolase n=1 Tax=Brachybacterium paraconglomeratum TaxID=173362 RepID=UPI0031E70F98